MQVSLQAAIGSSVFQQTIESVERLPADDQLLLVEIINEYWAHLKSA